MFKVKGVQLKIEFIIMGTKDPSPNSEEMHYTIAVVPPPKKISI